MWDAALTPEVTERWRGFQDAIWSSGLDPALLERCRRVVCRTLGDREGLAGAAAPGGEPDEAARAALDLAETFALDVHAVTDDQMGRVRAALGDARTVALCCALGVFEATSRARITFSRLP